MDSELTSPAEGGAEIRLDRLAKNFGELAAVTETTLTVRAGEFFTVLGPSGSGKTTTLRMIAGFVNPTRGDVYVSGRCVTRLAPQARQIGMVFQNYALFPHLSVYENVAFALRVRRIRSDEIRRSVDAALELVQLQGFENRMPQQLSGGQQQRVAFARAIVFRPRVLLLDEPLGALDRKLRAHMQFEIKRLQQRLKVTVFYITHDQEEALTMSDRVAVMNFGRVEQVGTPEELYERPSNRFVAAFLGDTNFLEGHITGYEGRAVRVRVADGSEFWAQAQTERQPTNSVAVGVRPERVSLVRASEPCNGGLRGIVTEALYVGDSIRYRIRTGPGIELIAKQPNGLAQLRWAPGDEVIASWNSADATACHDI